MAAKTKTTTPKGSKKTARATAVKTGAKEKKPPVKATKKAPVKKKRAPAKPKITTAMFEAWFYEQPSNIFTQLAEGWNEKNLNITLENHDGYDDWFNYFSTLPASHIRLLSQTGQDILGAEAYSALRRWIDIISNPARIDKIHQTNIQSRKGTKGEKGIVALAQENDRLSVLKAVRDKLADKLDRGAGSRDTAALARELTEIMTQIADLEKRIGPKQDTMLGKLMAEGPPQPGKRKRGNGSRNTSYASRVTIKDLEK